jgi:hypothetical protein
MKGYLNCFYKLFCVFLTAIGCLSPRLLFSEASRVELCFVEKPVLPKISNLHATALNSKAFSIKDKEILQGYKEEFEKKYGSNFLENQFNYNFLSLVCKKTFSCSTSIQKNAIHFLKMMFEEFSKSNYSKEDFRHYMNWSLNISSSLFFEKYLFAEGDLNDLFYNLTDISFKSIIPRSAEEKGRHEAFALQSEKGKVTALIKVVKGPRNAWSKVAPIMEQKGSAGLYEKVGYDFDVILGLKMTPATLLGKIKLENSSIEDVVIQKFISNSVVLSDLLHREDGAELIKSIPTAPAQMMALSGMIKGRLGGHLSNYLFHLKDGVIDTINDIDLEELLPPCNRLEKGMILYPLKEDRNQANRIDVSDLSLDLEEMAYKSTPLCRMCILGLPQNGKPFERACLKIITHNLLPCLLEGYHEYLNEKKEIRKQCLQAQKERLLKIQEICKQQLKLPEISLTPRDLYFYLFGGEHLYQLARERGYPPIVIFNQVIGDPLQHSMIDFSRPEKMLFCKLLNERDTSDQKEARSNFLFNNLLILENQE